MKLRVVYNSRLVRKGYYAWVLFPFMFFRQAQVDVTDQNFRHEMQHVYQVLRYGWWAFYIKYLWLLYKHGYEAHPYEIEAVASEALPLTADERYFKEKL